MAIEYPQDLTSLRDEPFPKQLAFLEARLRNVHSVWVGIAALLGVITGVFGVLAVVYARTSDSADSDSSLALAAVTGIGLALSPAAYLLVRARYTLLRDQVNSAMAINAATNIDGKPASYFDGLVQLNLANLSKNYSLASSHTERSFLAALVVAIAGFLLIAVGVGSGFVSGGSAQTSSYVASAAGVLTEFIASIFFYLYNRTVRQLKEYHDNLTEVQNFLLGFKVIEEAQGADRASMLSKMLDALVFQKSNAVTAQRRHSDDPADK